MIDLLALLFWLLKLAVSVVFFGFMILVLKATLQGDPSDQPTDYLHDANRNTNPFSEEK